MLSWHHAKRFDTCKVKEGVTACVSVFGHVKGINPVDSGSVPENGVMI
jgi:hypothetical protein